MKASFTIIPRNYPCLLWLRVFQFSVKLTFGVHNWFNTGKTSFRGVIYEVTIFITSTPFNAAFLVGI